MSDISDKLLPLAAETALHHDDMPVSHANVLLIGCGPHAKRIYVPALRKLEEKGLAKLQAVVELDETRKITSDYFQGNDIKQLYVSKLTSEYPPFRSESGHPVSYSSHHEESTEVYGGGTR